MRGDLTLTLASAGLVLVLAWVPIASSGTDTHLRPVLENEHVRVHELFASPGASSPMEVRPPGVRISLSKSRFEVTGEDGTVSIVDYNPGQIVWVEEPEHHAWTLLAGEAHIFFVDVKSAIERRPPLPVALAPNHSTIVDAEQHHLVLDNGHVRIIDGIASSGASSAPHTHAPSVLVSLAKSRFRVTIAEKTRIFDFEPAMVRWTNHFEHKWDIVSGDARVVMIEIKSAHDDPAFQRRQ